MIKNIIFDMGGVLIRWKPEEMLRGFDLSPEEKEIINRELFKSIEWIQQDRGVITNDEILKAVFARVPEKLWEPVEFLVGGWYQRFLFPMPGMAELVEELKENGYHLYLLSNASAALRDYKLPFFHFMQRFCNAVPYLDLTEVRPAVADAELAEIFGVPMGTPLLHMDEVDYDIDGKPVFCSSEYYVDGIIRHTVLRKKL